MNFLKLLVTTVLICISTTTTANSEIWLLSGPECNICAIYEQVKESRHYRDYLEVDGQRYEIKNISKLNIPKNARSAFEAASIGNRDWQVQLTVAVVSSGNVLYVGNIAESVDWSDGLVDPYYMDPPATVTLDALHEYGFDYGRYLTQKINLEYFIKRAVRPNFPEHDKVKINVVPTAEKANDVRVSIWGTALQPANNGLFISTRIKQLQSLLGETRVFTTYANGPGRPIRDTLIKNGDKYSFINSNVSSQFSSDFSGIDAWFSQIASSTHNNHLIVQVGHSGPAGIPVWGHARTVSNEVLADSIRDTGKEVVLVSGACHSGLLANAGQCGFYAAHPEAIATGCQTSLEAIESSDDYLKYFFNNADMGADANGDGLISFSEAHWFSAAQLESHNIVYSDTDFSVDVFFNEHPQKLPQALKIGTIQNLIKALSPEEQLAFRIMRKGLSDDLELNLSNHVELHKLAIEHLDGHTEETSQKRNQRAGLGYHLNLVLLARRALYLDIGNKFDSKKLACEQQPLTGYIDVALNNQTNATDR